jgi:hypothetical protein
LGRPKLSTRKFSAWKKRRKYKTICLPGFIKEIDNYKAFKKELKLFLLLQSFYSVEEFVSS